MIVKALATSTLFQLSSNLARTFFFVDSTSCRSKVEPISTTHGIGRGSVILCGCDELIGLGYFTDLTSHSLPLVPAITVQLYGVAMTSHKKRN